MPEPGDRYGEFELVREVGRGAMGTVWEARQPSLGRTVALKILAGSFAADPVWTARFRAEAGQASRLSHPGILAVFAIGQTGGSDWFAMELVDGEDLAHRLAREGRMAPPAAARLVREAALALHHAHEHGIVHRDVKPANLMLRGDGRVVVTDFGLAKTIGSGALTTTGLLVGTPYYMSPEVIAGRTQEIGPRTDVYGLGATLYELLAGRPPFLGATPIELIRKISEEEPEPPSRIEPAIPPDLETIVLTTLEKEPARRYPSAKALADDLDRFLGGETISVRRPGLVERVARRVRRNRLAWGIAAAAAVLLALTAAVFTNLLSAQEARHRKEILTLLSGVEADLAEGKVAEAEAKLVEIEELEQTPEERDRVRRSRERVSLERFFSAVPSPKESLARLRGWQAKDPARLVLAVDPADARIEVRGLLGPSAGLRPGEQEVRPGMYRLRLRSEGRVETIATLLVAPGAKAEVKIRLPAADPSSAGLVHYAGLWVPELPAAGVEPVAGAPLVHALLPYYLADRPVTAREYGEFLRTRTGEEAERLAPRGWRADRPSPRELDRPVLGLTLEQARAYAASRGMRLPTDFELKHAALASLPVLEVGAQDPAEAPDRPRGESPMERWRGVAAAIESAEGVRGLGFPAEWVLTGEDSGARWPTRTPGGAPETPSEAAASRVALRLAKTSM